MSDHDARLNRVAEDPTTPYWARDIIHAGLGRDPVDAASVLKHLSDLFNERCEAILSEVTS